MKIWDVATKKYITFEDRDILIQKKQFGQYYGYSSFQINPDTRSRFESILKEMTTIWNLNKENKEALHSSTIEFPNGDYIELKLQWDRKLKINVMRISFMFLDLPECTGGVKSYWNDYIRLDITKCRLLYKEINNKLKKL